MSAVVSINDALRAGAAALAGASDSPRLDAELLLGATLGLGRSGLIVRATEGVPAASERRYRQLLDARARGAPIAYLTGVREFWSLDLEVTPAVLVPRPETEGVVECALEHLPPNSAAAVLDLGTGSGAIALAIARERPAVRITAVDVSADALAVARGNGARLAPGRIDFRQGSWFEPLGGARFDLIVANPPYIAADDPALAALGAEPRLALSPGPTGLEALAAIIAGARPHLNAGGALVLEHGRGQHGAVAALLAAHGFTALGAREDRAGIARIAAGIIHPSQPGTTP